MASSPNNLSDAVCQHFSAFDPLQPPQIAGPFDVLAHARKEQAVFYMDKYNLCVMSRRQVVNSKRSTILSAEIARSVSYDQRYQSITEVSRSQMMIKPSFEISGPLSHIGCIVSKGRCDALVQIQTPTRRLSG